ncbi:MAG: hypothetical protein ABEK36_05320 [Candidatus Aenigmatarchaeota archaeon]
MKYKPRFYIDRYTSTNNTRLANINGEVFVKVIVSGIKNKNKISSVEVGKSGLTRLNNLSQFNTAYIDAQLNSMYQFRTRTGISGEKIEKVLKYWIRYPSQDYKIKRINRRGKYYTYVFDKKGKIKTYSKWKKINKNELIKV